MMLRRGNKEIWTALKYERLFDFCYACGWLDHTQIFCNYHQHPSIKMVYGPWLRSKYINPTLTQDFCQTNNRQEQENNPMAEINETTQQDEHSSKGKEILI